jgi:hypothetical protein
MQATCTGVTVVVPDAVHVSSCATNWWLAIEDQARDTNE